MSAALKEGAQVWATLQAGGPRLVGFIQDGPITVEGEVKYRIQVGKSVFTMAYREPSEPNENLGLTFGLSKA